MPTKRVYIQSTVLFDDPGVVDRGDGYTDDGYWILRPLHGRPDWEPGDMTVERPGDRRRDRNSRAPVRMPRPMTLLSDALATIADRNMAASVDMVDWWTIPAFRAALTDGKVTLWNDAGNTPPFDREVQIDWGSMIVRRCQTGFGGSPLLWIREIRHDHDGNHRPGTIGRDHVRDAEPGDVVDGDRGHDRADGGRSRRAPVFGQVLPPVHRGARSKAEKKPARNDRRIDREWDLWEDDGGAQRDE